MHAIFGLGNPGRRYMETRHNIGFIIIDQMAVKYQVPFKAGKGDYYFCEIREDNRRVLLVKPTTYMNHSGRCVAQILKYFPVNIQEILIVYDDFHLPFGTIRFRNRGSDGGHNGINSIIFELQTDQFDRLRFGIGDVFENATEHVLTKFTGPEKRALDKLVTVSGEGITSWINYGIETTMNKYNGSYLEDFSN